jgi:hypothetical protein
MKEIIFNLLMIILFLFALLMFGLIYLIDALPFNLTKKSFDPIYAFLEKWSSKMNNWAWQKRWGDRQKGTGYKNERDTL